VHLGQDNCTGPSRKRSRKVMQRRVVF